MLRVARVFGSPYAALHAPIDELVARGGISLDQARAIVAHKDAEAALQHNIEAWRSRGVELICIDDESYPAQLRDLRTPPPLLYVRGSLRPEDTRAVAVVGTREPDRAGAALARRLGHEFATRGFTIVSGLARGIDTAGHRGALLPEAPPGLVGTRRGPRGTSRSLSPSAEQGRTIAVLGCGLLRIYPSENARLAGRIAARGCLLSEVPPETEVQAGLLLARDRIQAALSRAVVVVEAHRECGSIVTARHAAQCGRLLYGVPWERPPFSEGWKTLRSMGALPITADADFDEVAATIDAHVSEPKERPLL
jgi:DNA processing protein